MCIYILTKITLSLLVIHYFINFVWCRYDNKKTQFRILIWGHLEWLLNTWFLIVENCQFSQANREKRIFKNVMQWGCPTFSVSWPQIYGNMMNVGAMITNIDLWEYKSPWNSWILQNSSNKIVKYVICNLIRCTTTSVDFKLIESNYKGE